MSEPPEAERVRDIPDMPPMPMRATDDANGQSFERSPIDVTREPTNSSWETFHWRERLGPELKIAAQLIALIPETPSRIERMLHLEEGVIHELWRENEYFVRAVTDYAKHRGEEIRSWRRSTLSRG